MESYLDCAATTPVCLEAREVMFQVMEKDFGNPSSKHTKGMEAERYITDTAQFLAKELKGKPKEIIFTSGGTEANNLALFGAARANGRKKKHIITTEIEHESVKNPIQQLQKEGFDVTVLPVDSLGRVSEKQVREALRKDTVLVSVMAVNNEIGSVQPIEQIGQMLKETQKDVLFHVDAIQAFGKYKLTPEKMGIDLLSVSGHKIHAPKGTGFLYVRDGVKLSPILYGGGQQKGMRSGTENVPGIAGLGAAAKTVCGKKEQNMAHAAGLKQRLIDGLLSFDGVTVNAFSADKDRSSPYIVSVSFDGVKSEVFLHALASEGICVSSGSACSSHRDTVSHTLLAIGVKQQLLDCTLRFSFSFQTTDEQIDCAIASVGELLPTLRRFVRH